MSPIDSLLDRLEGVRRAGRDRWLARCPAHDDRRPSLSIREADDGRVLLYCFTGCGAIEVLDALGLDWAALYPEHIDIHPTQRGPRRVAPPIPARDALELLDQESLVVEIIAHRLAQGESDARHAADLKLASGRIGAIRSAWLEAPR